jgi:putative tryptophan/tyrosine transport system substrate-binding protein
VTDAQSRRIVEFATQQRLPGIYPMRHFVEGGGLMSYGPSLFDTWKRSAVYVDKILKGAKAADLPVEQPTKYELVINLKTAKALGFTIPPAVLARADEVIQKDAPPNVRRRHYRPPRRAARGARSTRGQGLPHRMATLRQTPSLRPPHPRTNLGAFRQALQELGYVEGRGYVIEGRFAEGKIDRLPDLAAELVALQVDVIVAAGTPAAKAAKAATATIPIVFIGTTDPVGQGFVVSLARPGGNVTGVTSSVGPEIAGKQLQLFKEAVPRISRLAVLYSSDQDNPWVRVQRSAAPKLGMTLLPHDAKTLGELTTALAAITRERADGLFLFGSSINSQHFDLISEFAARSHLPTMYDDGDAVVEGGLMSYYSNPLDVRRHAARVVDKILKGAKPGDMPVERPTKFDLVVNLKTAKALGLTIAPSILARADQIIHP